MSGIFPGWIIRCGPALALAAVSGCAGYRPRRLPTAPDLAASPPLTVPAGQLRLPGLKPHRFDPSEGWDETAVMTLAVLDNPDLRAARSRAGVADAQLLEAGLLPDPVVTAGLSKSALRTGYAVGLAEASQAVSPRGARRAAARAQRRQVNLDILWQEWQTAERARELFIQSRSDQRLLGILAPLGAFLARVCQQEQAALERGDLAAGAASVELKTLAGVEANLRQVRLDANLTGHALDLLLGLRPDVRLHLTGPDPSRPMARAELHAAEAALPRRRADLLALQAGYQSQQERLREAVLAQFPSVSAGVQQARSAEEGIRTVGFTVAVSLPLFNRNRGRIAIEKATRDVLYRTYQARLDQAVSDADQLWGAARIMARQLRDI